MRQSGDYREEQQLTSGKLQDLLQPAVDDLDVEQARSEVGRFVKDPRALDVWSREFFKQVITRIVAV